MKSFKDFDILSDWFPGPLYPVMSTLSAFFHHILWVGILSLESTLI